jgi:transcriptional regulator with XRE-family HTH domain
VSKLHILSKEEHEKRMNLYNQGLSDGLIAKYRGVKRSAINQWRNKNNLKPHYSGRHYNDISEEENKKRMNLYNQGLTDKQCAEKLGLTKDGFNQWRRGKNLLPSIKTIKCISCGEIFKTRTKTKKYCDDCKEIRRSIYFELRTFRSEYASLCVIEPKKARQFKDEMEQTEGKEFKDFAINGIFDNPKVSKIKSR